jgi:peptide/nickel transport system permease protein
MKRLPTFNKIPASVRVAGIVFAIILFFVIFANLIFPDALAQDIRNGSLGMFENGHILGTDKLGRDVFQLLLAGARSAIVGPILIATGSIIVGLVLGGLAGWRGGLLDWIISRYADLTLSMPSLLLAIVAAGIIGGGYYVSVLVMIILYSPFDIRLVRSAVIQQKGKPYIEAGLVMRLSTIRILIKHILPNISLVVFVNFFLNIAYGIVSMSALSYLGVGVPPGAADWGRQLLDGRTILYDNPAASLSAGFAIVITALCVNIIGNYLTERSSLS